MIYEFQCNLCRTIFEVKASLAEKEKGLKPVCPKCNSNDTHQIVASFAMISGNNDYSNSLDTHYHNSSACSTCSSTSCSSCKH